MEKEGKKTNPLLLQRHPKNGHVLVVSCYLITAQKLRFSTHEIVRVNMLLSFIYAIVP